MYTEVSKHDNTEFQLNALYRDIAVLELLFATGARVSELCSLSNHDVDLINKAILITGKGSKERIIQIGNDEVITALKTYSERFHSDIEHSEFFFVNRLQKRLSEQSVRFMINKYVDKAGITNHITPHMFRHSFATLLLEEDVDIRYIQSYWDTVLSLRLKFTPTLHLRNKNISLQPNIPETNSSSKKDN